MYQKRAINGFIIIKIGWLHQESTKKTVYKFLILSTIILIFCQIFLTALLCCLTFSMSDLLLVISKPVLPTIPKINTLKNTFKTFVFFFHIYLYFSEQFFFNVAFNFLSFVVIICQEIPELIFQEVVREHGNTKCK